MLHYVPQHVSSSTLLILRRTNCITTASGIVTLCKQPHSMQVESGLPFVPRRSPIHAGGYNIQRFSCSLGYSPESATLTTLN